MCLMFKVRICCFLFSDVGSRSQRCVFVSSGVFIANFRVCLFLAMCFYFYHLNFSF